MWRAWLMGVLWTMAACGGGEGDPDRDAEVSADGGGGGPIDATRPDAQAPDASAPDAMTPDAGPPGCNGAVELCGRRYDEVAWLTAHNAMANQDDGFRPPNHVPDMPTQLAEGVRGLMLDTYAEEDGLFLCHGYCALGRTPLVEGLGQIGRFLAEHPREVISIIFEAYISPEETAAAFAEAGLLDHVHTQALDAPWPTLGEMIAADRRLVVFSDERGGPPWHHFVWDHAWETHFHVEAVEDFDCAPNRGDPGNTLFILNHFITRPIALASFAEEANPALGAHAEACLESSGQLPNFVTVDFYRIGDPAAVVRALNGLD